MNIPDHVYNWLIWLVDFYAGGSHNVRFNGISSEQLNISASIIQGSAIGPASYVVNAADLTDVTAGNLIFKYADDTYTVIPASNVSSRDVELDHVDLWAEFEVEQTCPLKSYSHFTDCKRRTTYILPPAIAGISRVTTIKILGITITNHQSCPWMNMSAMSSANARSPCTFGSCCAITVRVMTR